MTGIEVSGPLHLKTLISLCGKDTLCASTETGDSYKMLEVSLVKNSIIPNCLSLLQKLKWQAVNKKNQFEFPDH